MITSRLKLPQKATYWLAGANNGTGGKTWGSPITISCITADVDEITHTPEGKHFHATKVYYSKTKIPLGAYIVQDETTAAAPTEDAKEVMTSNSNESMTDLKKATV